MVRRGLARRVRYRRINILTCEVKMESWVVALLAFVFAVLCQTAIFAYGYGRLKGYLEAQLKAMQEMLKCHEKDIAEVKKEMHGDCGINVLTAKIESIDGRLGRIESMMVEKYKG